MEIRALTGFEKSTREQYGRSYTPLNGGNTLLGVYYPEEGNFYSQELTKPNDTFVPAGQNPNNFFVRYRKPLLVAGGIVAAFLLYKKFK